MKKPLFFLSIFGLLLSGCSLEDLTFWKKNQDSDSSQKQDDEQKEDKGQGEGDGGGEGEQTTVHVSSVTLNKPTLTLEEMQSEKLTYTILPINATNKNVEWFTSDATVASVVDGLVSANNPGTAVITVKTEDGSKTSTCDLTVTAKVPEVKTITTSLVFNDKGYSGDTVSPYTDQIKIDDSISVHFSKGEGSNNPVCIKYNKVWSARMYPGNELVVFSSDPNIRKIEFTFDSNRDSSSNTLTSDPEGFSVDTWTGTSDEVRFVAGGTSGYRCISSIKVTYEGEVSPTEDINLGVKTIKEVKEYIAEHPVEKNAYGNGVNEHRTVTIKGFALAKIDLVKYTAAYGLNVSEHGKVIMADETGYIAAASAVNNQGTSLWGKVADYACKDTSKYVVTGYLSEYLGHPEIVVTSFQWDQSLDISWSPTVISEATVSINEFYTHANDVYYNCAGHGYGEVLTLNKLKLYYLESDGQGKRYYNFTDGTNNNRVNAFNLSSLTVGNNYDITGIVSIKNFSPIIVAFSLKQSVDQTEINFDYESVATNISILDLKKIHGSQDDVDTRTTKFQELIEAYGTIYKTTGYLTAVEEGGKYYIGISDSYIERKDLINGKDNAMANYGISLIKNEDFWNTTEDELYRYNPLFDEYVLEDKEITVYYIVRQQRYSSNKPMWEILLLPDFLNDLQNI